jgi:hypothetical protein
MIRVLLGAMLALAAMPAFAQTMGMLEDWHDGENERREQRNDEQDARNQGGRSGTDEGVRLAGWGVGVVQTGSEFLRDWQALDEDTANCGAAYTDSSAPTIPSMCADKPDCEACYAEATRKIDFNRFYIERAHCITVTNIKMANSAMAFGDSTSGIHGVAGLSWQLQGKPQIKEAVEGLQRTYVNKAGQYLSNLDQALHELGRCEARYYSENDWYERYGWIYLNFMKSKYASKPE